MNADKYFPMFTHNIPAMPQVVAPQRKEVASYATYVVAGRWLVEKSRERAGSGVGGTFNAAKNLRKQGVPLELARQILLGR